MKTLCAIFLATLFGSSARADDRLIPFDDFYVSVETNDWLNRPRKQHALNVSVRVSRSAHEQDGSTSIEVDCHEFSSARRELAEEDITAFLEACDAATKRQDYRKEISSKTQFGYVQTVYEVVTVDQQKRVSVTRGKAALFAPDEGAKLKNALAQAHAGEAWFRKLLAEQKLPAKQPNAKPPQANNYYLTSKLGEVAGEGLSYEVSLGTHSFNAPPSYQMGHDLRFITLGGNAGSSGGEWVKGMVDQIALALNALTKKQAFYFESPGNPGEQRFAVKANLATQQADVEFQPGSFFGRHSSIQGSFSMAQLAEIRQVMAKWEARKKWFVEHEDWFFERQ
jgi:hypothetical protein